MDVSTALVLQSPGRLVLTEIPVPAPSPGEAVLRVEACGLCGTDHEIFGGVMPARLPLIPGHEVVGIVAEASPEFSAARGFSIGDRVAVEVFQRCASCEACASGAYQLCRNHGLADSYGNTPLDVGAGLWGGYATHLTLTADSLLHLVPTGLSAVDATLFNPYGAGVRWGVTLPGVGSGAVVAILGPGLRGLGAVAAAVRAGADYVLLTGAGKQDADRLATGQRFGATRVVDVLTEDAKAILKKDTGGLADVVVDVTAAAPQAFTQAIDLVRPGGTVVVAGTRGTSELEGFNPDRIALKEVRVLGARGVDGDAYRAALDMLASNAALRDVSRRTVALDPDEMSHLLDTMAHGPDRPLHAVVVIGA